MEDLHAFPHQVAGSFPMLKRQPWEICKPATRNELHVYTIMNFKRPKILAFAPKFLGKLEINTKKLHLNPDELSQTDIPNTESLHSKRNRATGINCNDSRSFKRLRNDISSVNTFGSNEESPEESRVSTEPPEGKHPWSVGNLWDQFLSERHNKVLKADDQVIESESQGMSITATHELREIESKEEPTEHPSPSPEISREDGKGEDNDSNAFLSNNDNLVYLVLENLTDKFTEPHVLDLKVGTQQHGRFESQEKKASKLNKCKTTTSSSLGIRAQGMQVFRNGRVCFKDKYWGRSLDEQGLKIALREFVTTKHRNENGISYERLDKEVIQRIIHKLEELKTAVMDCCWRFYGSSVLITFDGAVPPPGKEVKVKVIDFAKTETDSDIHGYDEGFVFGLTKLIKIFQNILDSS